MKIKLLSVLLLIMIQQAYAQTSPDTLQLTVPEAEKAFLQNNLSLVASKYNIDAATALIRQAKLWDNPVLLTDQTLYDGRFFNHTKLANGESSGQIYVQIQELIRTAGKIRKLTDLATTNARISELQFDQLMNNLKYSLRINFYQCEQLISTLSLFNVELEQLNKLLRALEAELKAGNISQKDFLRIQALQLSVLQEENEYRKQLSDVQSELHTLLGLNTSSIIKPSISQSFLSKDLPAPDSILTVARLNNPDYLLEKSNLLYQKQNLYYQQALRSPDVTVGVEYDKASSYVPNFYGLTVSLPLPAFNRNQGNIAAAGFSVKQEQALVSQKDQKLFNDIQNAFTKLRLSINLANAGDPDFINKYRQLMQNAFIAYQQRQMNLLDFVDLFEAYKDAQLKYLQGQFNLQKAGEDINILAGKDIVK